MRLVIIPRGAGTPADDFYPWLVRTVNADHADVFESIDVVDMPLPHEPELGLWIAATRIAIGDAQQAARTVIAGHSVGFQAVMRALAELEDDVTVAAAVGIAAWWSIDEPWPAIRPWIDTPFDHDRTRAAARRIECLLSTNDPFTQDHERTKHLFEDRLGAHVRVVEDARHFNVARAPEVLRTLLDVVG
ncbi:MAG TPA: alpha/beta hydrolase [Nannocystaceae bacterium]|nr:alpha/beta hydrolase [Nannocystaceae bacterium]